MKKFFIGIDVSKETLDATFLFKDDHYIENYKRFENNDKGFRELLKWAKDCAKSLGYKLNKNETWFCCENTGSYSVNLCEFIAFRHMEIAEEHPTKIHASRSAQRGKTDKGDSLAIADYAMRYEDKLSAYVLFQKMSQNILGGQAIGVKRSGMGSAAPLTQTRVTRWRTV